MSSFSGFPVEIPEHLSKPVGTSGTRLLEIERSKASFSPDDLRSYLYGRDHLDRLKRVLPIVENDVRPPSSDDLAALGCELTLCTHTPLPLLPGPPLFPARHFASEHALPPLQPAFDKSQIHYMSREEKYVHGLKKDKRLVQLTREHGWSQEDVKVAEELIGSFRALFRLGSFTTQFRVFSYQMDSDGLNSADMPAAFGLRTSAAAFHFRFRPS